MRYFQERAVGTVAHEYRVALFMNAARIGMNTNSSMDNLADQGLSIPADLGRLSSAVQDALRMKLLERRESGIEYLGQFQAPRLAELVMKASGIHVKEDKEGLPSRDEEESEILRVAESKEVTSCANHDTDAGVPSAVSFKRKLEATPKETLKEVRLTNLSRSVSRSSEGTREQVHERVTARWKRSTKLVLRQIRLEGSSPAQKKRRNLC